MRFSPIPIALSIFFLSGKGGAAETETTIALGINGGPPTENATKSIPYDAFETSFVVTTPPGLIRYRLKGFESDWNERSGEMFLVVNFHNGKGDQIAQQSFLAKGRSQGWNGSDETSTATDRRENIIVPPDAHDATITISSAGPATSVGTFAITNLHIFNGSRDLIGPGTSTQWSKGGTRPSMASIRMSGNGSPIYILTDNDTTGHADWTSIANAASLVTPGETLELQWQEFFCTGMGDPFTVKYGQLPSGSYRFEVESLGFSGKSPGELTGLPIKVALPYWRNPWYWTAFAVLFAIASSLWARHLIRKRIHLHLRQAQMIADERLRIARDLHDDLGARLSHISLLGSHAMSTTPDSGTREKFRQITSMSRELVTSLSETVWMLNSKNDHLESLVDYLCRMVSGLCQSLDIRCRINAISPPDDRPINGDVRHHITMVVKEAVNNALKHSRCTEIRLKIDLQPSGLEIHISDNGIGLDHTDNEQGNGLENIRQRMGTLGGSLRIGQSEEGGVSILLHVPL